MKYPTFEMIQRYEGKEDTETLLNMIVSCIDYIFDEEQIYYSKDTTEKEMVDFIENLQSKDLEKIKSFFDKMPKISKDVEFKCNKCGYTENINLQGVQSFFG
jgi:rubrerythrin